MAESILKQRARFAALGAGLALACWFSQLQWDVPFVGWLPWTACLAVLLLRFARGPRFRAGAFLLGTLGVAVLGTCALVAWFALGPTLEGALRRRDFDAELWRDQERLDDDGLWPPRKCMVDDLLASGVLDTLTESEVLHLLGPPADESFPFGARHCDLHYYLGPDHIGLDSEWLFIDFDEDGVAERLWIYMD